MKILRKLFPRIPKKRMRFKPKVNQTIASEKEQQKEIAPEKLLMHKIDLLNHKIENYRFKLDKRYEVKIDFSLSKLSLKLKGWIFVGVVIIGFLSTILNVYLWQYKEWVDYSKEVKISPNSKTTIYEVVYKEIEIKRYRRIADQKEQELKQSVGQSEK